LRSRPAQKARQNAQAIGKMNGEAACDMAIPGSGHSRAPKDKGVNAA